MSKNLLSENMLRFGTKNLSEGAKRNLVLESVMETIKEHGLHNEVKRRLMEFAGGKTAQEIADGLWKAFASVGESNILEVINNLQYIKTATEFNAVNKIMYDAKGKGILSAIAKYCPGKEVTKVPPGKKTHIVDELVRIWYPGVYQQVVKAGDLGAASIFGYKELEGKEPLKSVITDTTLWQDFKDELGYGSWGVGSKNVKGA